MEESRNKKLKSSMGECPKCCQIPRANIYQCANGHSICELCSTQVTLCPTCRSPGVTIRNLFAESLLDNNKFKCSWSLQGCKKTMWRRELSAHEDQCAQNPDIIRFCTHFPGGEDCGYKFTSKWLSEPENCANFINHLGACFPYFGLKKVKCGEPLPQILNFERFLSKRNPRRPIESMRFDPILLSLPSPNQLYLLCVFIKANTLRKKTTVFFAFVQLTLETTPMVAKFTINGNPNSNMVSQYGQHSLPSQSWTQKAICFNQFVKLVEYCEDSRDTEICLPYSLPLSYLAEYYLNAHEQLLVEYTVELAS